MGSGISCLFALYSENSICLNVGSFESKTTAKCVGLCLFMISKIELAKPKTVDVS